MDRSLSPFLKEYIAFMRREESRPTPSYHIKDKRDKYRKKGTNASDWSNDDADMDDAENGMKTSASSTGHQGGTASFGTIHEESKEPNLVGPVVAWNDTV